jgi:hypothetical protein
MALVDQSPQFMMPCMGWRDRAFLQPDRNRWLWWLIAAGAAIVLLKGKSKNGNGGQTK